MIDNTPDGVVIFFPSYAYLNRVVSAWKKSFPPSSPGHSLWDTITSIKPAFLEPRAMEPSDQDVSLENSASISRPRHSNSDTPHESILTSYAAAIDSNNGKGALLLSVVGGSLSEGINFSDALGRAVIVVGLPFPNPHSAEWKAKTAYVESKAVARAASAGSNASKGSVDIKAASREVYENVCMRAVNQCIGRAIRHKNDYAAILLLDRRYGLPRIQAKLPGWIKESLRQSGSVGAAIGDLKKFFTDKEPRNA